MGDADGKWKAIRNFTEGLCGSGVEVIDELYKSETATNFNNKSIAWLLKNYNRIYDDPDLAPQPVDLLSQASPTDMEGPLQLRSAGAVRFS